MSWPDAIVSVALLAFLGLTIWLAARPTPTRGDDRHGKELAKLTAEVAALREQLARDSGGTREARDSHTTTTRT